MNYKKEKQAMVEKYQKAIGLISETNNVDIGVAFDMLVANETQDGKYAYVNHEEFLRDWQSLVELCEK